MAHQYYSRGIDAEFRPLSGQVERKLATDDNFWSEN